MANVTELTGSQSQLAAVLAAGVAAISEGATITFQKYIRRVLPLDGYVFWLAGEKITVPGSIHYSTRTDQVEDETNAINSFAFTTTVSIKDLNEVNSQTMLIAIFDCLRIGFSSRGMFYEQAGLFHYTGDAVYPALASQLVDNMLSLSNSTLIVSNSLPAWLALQTFNPIYLAPLNPGFTLYPSFLVPTNLVPPYGVVHIDPGMTQALQAIPYLDSNSSHYQLTTDQVRITLYGATNNSALDFVDVVNQYSLATDSFGIMGTAIVRDEKRPQSEIQVLAMKKTIVFDVNYYQTRINDIARQLITDVVVQYTVSPYPTAA